MKEFLRSKIKIKIQLIDISRLLVLLEILFLPILFLPFLEDSIELPKAFIFLILTLVSFILWILHLLGERDISFRASFLAFYLSLLAIVYLISTIFSEEKYFSLVGFRNGYYHESLPLFFGFLVFFLLLINLFNENRYFNLLLKTFLISIFLVILGNILTIFILPPFFTKIHFWSSFSLTEFSVLLSVTLPIFLVGLYLNRKRLIRIIWLIPLILIFFLLFFLDNSAANYTLLAALIFLFLLHILSGRPFKRSWLLFLIVLIGFSLFYLFISPPSLGLPQEVKLSTRISKEIAQKSLKGKNLILGNGPQIFFISFEKFKPSYFNNNPLGNLHFIKAGNQWAQMVISLGLVATLLWFLILLILFKRLFQAIFKSLEESWSWAFLTSLSAFLVAGFFTTFSFVLFLSFVIVLGLGVNSYYLDKKEIPLLKPIKPRTNSLLTLVLATTFIALIYIAYRGGQILLAEAYYSQSLKLIDSQKLEDAQKFLEKSLKLNPYSHPYRLNLAQILTQKIFKEIQKGSSSREITPNITAINNLLNYRTILKPVEVLEQEAFILSQLERIRPSFVDQTLNKLTQAQKREPLNAFIYRDLGRAYYRKAQYLSVLERNETDEAKKKEYSQSVKNHLITALSHLQTADKLKQNFREVWWDQIEIHQLLDQKEEALKILEKIKLLYPDDPRIEKKIKELKE